MYRHLVGIGLALVAAAFALVSPAVALDSGATGTVDVAGGAEAVADPVVDVALATADPEVTTVRVSLDGATWREEPMAPQLSIDLRDAAIGGADHDGTFTLRVRFGDGVTFGDPVTDAVLLDREGPGFEGFNLEWLYSQFDPTITTGVLHDDGVGTVDGWRYSFDQVHWSAWTTGNVLDFRDPAAGGSWTQGERQAWVQGRDTLGNVGPVATDTTTLSVEPYYDLPVTMELPLEAVTGSLFTARPHLPLDMVPPPDAVCYWRLTWGNDEAILDYHWNDTWGAVYWNRKASKGGCDEWTFTLPYGPTLQYRLEYSMCIWDGDSGCGGAAFYDTVFHARWGTSDRRITESNQPLAYILPSRIDTVIGQPITYHLYAVGGYTLPKSSIWTTQCYCRLGPWETQRGGDTFTFTPDTKGNWIVWWNGGSGLFEFNAGYDPAARPRDRTAPRTTTPVARIAGGVPGDRIPVTVSWTGRDTGWGIDHYRLWRSVDGGAWKAVRLARPRSTSATVWVDPGQAVRFRVRAWDKAGHAGTADVGPVLRPAIVPDDAATAAWPGTWAVIDDEAALGGAYHESATADSSARFTITGRAVALLVNRGPGQGRAKVSVDGKVVATIDLLAASDESHAIGWTQRWSRRGTHTIVVTVLGTSGRPAIGIDGVAVLR